MRIKKDKVCDQSFNSGVERVHGILELLAVSGYKTLSVIYREDKVRFEHVFVIFSQYADNLE